MDSQIYISPILPINLFLLSWPTPHPEPLPWACPSEFCPIVLSPPLPPQSIYSFYYDRHHILRRSCESVCPSSAQFVHLPRATPTPLTSDPISLSVLVGGKGGVGFVTWYPLLTSESDAPLYLSVLVGGVVVDTWAPSRTPDSAVSIRPGEEELFWPVPLRTHPTPPWSPFCPQKPTHSADSNSVVLCRIPRHRLAIAP